MTPTSVEKYPCTGFVQAASILHAASSVSTSEVVSTTRGAIARRPRSCSSARSEITLG